MYSTVKQYDFEVIMFLTFQKSDLKDKTLVREDGTQICEDLEVL